MFLIPFCIRLEGFKEYLCISSLLFFSLNLFLWKSQVHEIPFSLVASSVLTFDFFHFILEVVVQSYTANPGYKIVSRGNLSWHGYSNHKAWRFQFFEIYFSIKDLARGQNIFINILAFHNCQFLFSQT